jgi:hypothetical protein
MPAADPMTSTRQETPAGLSPHGPTDTIAADGSDTQQQPSGPDPDETAADPARLRPPTGPAIWHPATRDAYRRYQRRSRSLLTAGAALLVVSFALDGILGKWCGPGDRVSVVYDPGDPARATIVGENNQSLLLSMAVRMPFTLGSYLLGPGVFYWRRGRRLRKDLARADWRPYR